MKLKEEKMLRLLREIDTENWRDLVSLDELEADPILEWPFPEAGRPTSRQSYPRQLSILSYLGGDSIRPSTSRRGEGSDGRANNAQDRGEGTRVSGKISDNLLDKNETGLSTGFNRGESRQSQKNVLGQNIDSTLEKIQIQAMDFMKKEKPLMMKSWKIQSEEDPEYQTMISALTEIMIKEIIES